MILAIVTVLDVAPNLSWFLLLLSSVILTKFLVELKHGRFSVDLLMGIAVGSLSIVGNVAYAVLTRGVRELPKFLKYGRSYRNSVMLGFASAIMIKVSVIILGITGVLPLWAVVGLGDDGSTVIASMIAFFVLLKK